MSLFTDRFKELRADTGKTQAKMAEELDMTPQALSYYANGREPNYDLLIRFADYFGVSVDYLLGRTESKQPELSAASAQYGLTEKALEILGEYADIKWTQTEITGKVGESEVRIDLSKDKRTLLNILNQCLEESSFQWLLIWVQTLTCAVPDRMGGARWGDTGRWALVPGSSVIDDFYKTQAHKALDELIETIRRSEFQKLFPDMTFNLEEKESAFSEDK